MGYDSPLKVAFLFDDLETSEIRQFVDLCLGLGCRTQRDGGNDQGLYLGPPTDYDLVELPLDEAVSQLAESSSGQLSLWKDDLDFTVEATTELASSVSAMQLAFDPVHFRPREDSETTVEARLDTLIWLICQLYLRSGALHVVGRSEPLEDGSHAVKGSGSDLRAGRVDAVFWLNIFAPQAVERLGRQKLLSTGWMAQELADGSILLVLSENPLLFGYSADRDRLEKELGLRT